MKALAKSKSITKEVVAHLLFGLAVVLMGYVVVLLWT